METATNSPIRQSPGNALPVNLSSVDESSLSMEIFLSHRLPARRHYQRIRYQKRTPMHSDLALKLHFEKFYGAQL